MTPRVNRRLVLSLPNRGAKLSSILPKTKKGKVRIALPWACVPWARPERWFANKPHAQSSLSNQNQIVGRSSSRSMSGPFRALRNSRSRATQQTTNEPDNEPITSTPKQFRGPLSPRGQNIRARACLFLTWRAQTCCDDERATRTRSTHVHDPQIDH